ncbi:MAG: isocitrate/isopropylmalate dehydrogenase family protein [Chloroflexaceae bacterium]
MRICVIPGDGIGPEVIGAAVRVLRALAPDALITEAEAGWGAFERHGVALPAATLAAARAADATLFGAVASPSHAVPGYRSPIVQLRRELDLYANIRPVSGTSVGKRVDLVIVRENTEDLYIGRERLEDDGATAVAERLITRRASARIARAAFDLARRRAADPGRPPQVTVVHKANVLRVSDGLFRETVLAAARAYPEVLVEEMLVDVAAMRLAQMPERFDVLVTTNMFGDILSDVACIHGGGLGLAASANLGDAQALFEPVHGAAPDIAGQGTANPLAAITCVAMLLEWRGLSLPAARLRAAIASLLRDGPHTPDLGGTAKTSDVTESVLARL